MEILIRDSLGHVHRRYRDPRTKILSTFESANEEYLKEFEEVEESDLADISSEAWCKHCFEMREIDLD